MRLEEKILFSLGRCNNKGLSKNMNEPKIRLISKELQIRLNENKVLISIFKDNIKKIKNFINGEYLFLLVDSKGILLSEYTGKKGQQLDKSSIKMGVSFSEESSGTNAISVAMDSKEEVYLTPEQHYCDFLQQWYCFALPLYFNKEIIGYLDVSTISFKLKQELMGIALLLRDNIIKDLKVHKKLVSSQQKNFKRKVADKQIKIVKFLAQGLTEQEVAQELSCSKSTIKYHKKKLFAYLDVGCTREAIIKALQQGLIKLAEI
ncbi:transcriptional activator of acetoin/glycerol metabolism [Halobacteroides halobius DSM 5150]|uniref:Transcriptional activator of acetoin/glycerol metabolism n=1 Tax=Halobacteroides halobius (strain ATCC 35273 / DSM 5150 / MD-1) TaxID=748449 RepID=L0KBG0_HALHC|nr:LuxR C-terminal-related transcriptional regulator [Halobacteroides halobius]AGB41870.1 transcriptional activator of acetoin/glycerol metabolism [Halobacteroides halobius DSM 5150]